MDMSVKMFLNLRLLTVDTFEGSERDFPQAICCADRGQRV
jgi:hypothetical protein